jgi:hypothetical protein
MCGSDCNALGFRRTVKGGMGRKIGMLALCVCLENVKVGCVGFSQPRTHGSFGAPSASCAWLLDLRPLTSPLLFSSRRL